MDFKLDKVWLKRCIYVILTFTACFIVYLVLSNFSNIFTGIWSGISYIFSMISPIILGGVIAYFLFRPMSWLENQLMHHINYFGKHQRFSRLMATLVVYLLSVLVIVSFFRIAVPSIINSVMSLINSIPEYGKVISEALTNNSSQLGILFQNINFDYTNLQEVATKSLWSLFGDSGKDSISNISSFVTAFAKSTTTITISIIGMFFSGFYILLDKEKLVKQFDRLNHVVLSEKYYAKIKNFLHIVDNIFYKYFAGKILTSALIGLFAYLGLLVIDPEYAPLLGLIVGVTNVIPYFGPVLGGISGFLLTIFISPVQAIWVTLWIVIVQQFDGNVLSPAVLGRIVELSPFWVLVSVLIGGTLFGPFGMFIAIPFFGVIRVLINQGLERAEKKEALKRDKENKKDVSLSENMEEDNGKCI